jgi:peptide-methionine (S)-S-oxide reductase
MAKATFGAGCFWGVEAAFRRIDGVTDAAVGYAGGHKENPSYREVCSGDTGHAEVVGIEYDPARVSYETLLDAFWEMHDPTQLNRQGPDVGDQYRSVVFYYTPEQEEAALASKERLDASGELSRPVATQPRPRRRRTVGLLRLLSQRDEVARGHQQQHFRADTDHPIGAQSA